MKIRFPDNFIFGTSTSAYQTETAVEHDWLNVKSRDGHIFHRTTDHEKKLSEDAEIIASVARDYRMSLMWSKLQKKPYGEFDQEVVRAYDLFLEALVSRGVAIMMVMHHFANPIWFSAKGGWANKENIDVWIHFAKQLVDTFGCYVSYWNTFNEPNLYTGMSYLAGEFPPYKKNIIQANIVIRNMAVAHTRIYDYTKSKYPENLVGISHNCAVFEGDNWLGVIPAKLFDWCYMTYAENLFRKTDFFGMSYYSRIGFDPYPVTYLTTPEKIKKAGKSHDDMWEYYPDGLEECILRFWKRYQKPVIITENGISTQDDAQRIQAISQYAKSIHSAMAKGADVRGYYHWSTWDNFEWSLGPTFRFGLYACDPVTKDRHKKPSADIYSRLAFSKEIDV
jgi:beta-glucosidase